jgi:hypothetical protein
MQVKVRVTGYSYRRTGTPPERETKMKKKVLTKQAS